jgi:hypothetical protein
LRRTRWKPNRRMCWWTHPTNWLKFSLEKASARSRLIVRHTLM